MNITEIDAIPTKFLMRFKKNYSLPIPIVEPQYFQYYLNTLDLHFHTLDKFQKFKAVYDIYNTALLDFSDNLQNQIITDIKNSTFYQKFTKFNFPNHQLTLTKDNLYRIENKGKKYIKIDLQCANYQSFKFANSFLSEDITFLQNSYTDFIAQYTHFDYFIESKQLRQIIFGYLNASRQQNLLCLIIERIYNFLISNSLFTPNDLVASNSDELIFYVNDNLFANIETYMTPLFSAFPNINITITPFTLEVLESALMPFYVFKFQNNLFEFKCVPLTMFMQVYKKYLNLPTQEEDFLFYNEKQIAKYLQPLWEE